jgi:arsenical-resistance protein 2
MSTATKIAAEIPWHAAFPAPRGVAPSISREELLQWIRGDKQAGKDFVLIDLRRADYEVWHIDRIWCEGSIF